MVPRLGVTTSRVLNVFPLQKAATKPPLSSSRAEVGAVYPVRHALLRPAIELTVKRRATWSQRETAYEQDVALFELSSSRAEVGAVYPVRHALLRPAIELRVKRRATWSQRETAYEQDVALLSFFKPCRSGCRLSSASRLAQAGD